MRSPFSSVVAPALAALALAACATAPDVVSEPRISADRLAEGIATIAADEFGGRYPGTDGERLTLDWLLAQYQAMPGVEPGGPNGEWLQPVDLERYAPGTATATWAGPDGARHDLAPGTDIVLRSASNDGQADLDGVPVVFAGYGIHAPERNWDDYGDLDVSGKVVVLLSGEPAGELFNGAYATVHATGFRKEAEAFGRGAVGVLMLRRYAADDPRWATGVRYGQGQRTHTPGIHDLELEGSVPEPLLTAWAAAAGQDAAALLDAVDSGDFRAVDLTGVTLTARIAETRTVERTYNLIARIPGTDRPDETVLYSAHWDHVRTADEPDESGDHIFNGAWDNASGTVGVVEVARAFSSRPPLARSVVFAHVTAEEQGLLGGFWYAAYPVWPLETTVANINIDMLPLSAATRDIAIFGKGQNTLEDDLAVLAEVEGRYVTDDRQPEQNFYFRSDHFPYALRGVPALMPWHGVDLDEGGVEVGQPAYDALFAARYHQLSDEWDPAYDLTSAVENLTLLYRLGHDLASGDRWPQWKPGSEFGPVRNASASARE